VSYVGLVVSALDIQPDVFSGEFDRAVGVYFIRVVEQIPFARQRLACVIQMDAVPRAVRVQLHYVELARVDVL